MPGVEAAGLSTWPPGTTLGDPDRLVFDGTDAQYFAAAGLRLIRGRTYTAAEVRARQPVAVVNARVVREHWGTADPIGATLERVSRRHAHVHVIGVVADAYMFGLQAAATPIVYVPGVPEPMASMIVRVRDPQESLAAIQQALVGLSPAVKPSAFVVADRFDREMARPRGVAIVAAGIGVLALGLSLVGLFGVTAFLVGARTREIGIRMALGARTSEIVRGVVGDGMRPVLIGLAAGALAALLAGRVIAGMLYGISAHDPIAVGGGIAVLLITTTIAVLLPARRAMRVDPAVTLRDS
jgi:hypothetical protein